jgi:hypothetical protein
MSEWQPIITAPKDGEPILAWKPDERRSGDWMTAVYWSDYPFGWMFVGGIHVVHPTHWMPLPDPPQ